MQNSKWKKENAEPFKRSPYNQRMEPLEKAGSKDFGRSV